MHDFLLALAMNARIVLLTVAAAIAGCASRPAETPVAAPAEKPARSETRAEPQHRPASQANTADAYKRDLALRIAEANASKVYPGRPHALLRSVVVVRYAVDAQGNLVRHEIMRSNRDSETEATALASLRNAAPFPRPASHLLRRGQFELSETWLFNNDGRFQLRTVAQPQMDR
ncbi:TonB family protein [Noviherbaspirillum sp.]|uniref:TonB family protein n=1 Tax=Noviherbaspirillum sp. TaxID=1926288 RepID=UPI002D771512|nr:TonB family protein [Noviherbaspirillum sp.]